MSKMSKFAEFCGLKIGEKFFVKGGHYSPYVIKDDEIYDSENEVATYEVCLTMALKEDSIVKVEDMTELKEGFLVYCIEPNGEITEEGLYDPNNAAFVALKNTGNLFPTRELAEKNVIAVMAKYKGILKA